MNENRNKIMFPKNYYNCKYLLILYLILLKLKNNTEWNNFADRFNNQSRMDKFKDCSNYRKRFIWKSYLDILLLD